MHCAAGQECNVEYHQDGCHPYEGSLAGHSGSLTSDRSLRGYAAEVGRRVTRSTPPLSLNSQGRRRRLTFRTRLSRPFAACSARRRIGKTFARLRKLPCGAPRGATHLSPRRSKPDCWRSFRGRTRTPGYVPTAKRWLTSTCSCTMAACAPARPSPFRSNSLTGRESVFSTPIENPRSRSAGFLSATACLIVCGFDVVTGLRDGSSPHLAARLPVTSLPRRRVSAKPAVRPVFRIRSSFTPVGILLEPMGFSKPATSSP